MRSNRMVSCVIIGVQIILIITTMTKQQLVVAFLPSATIRATTTTTSSPFACFHEKYCRRQSTYCNGQKLNDIHSSFKNNRTILTKDNYNSIVWDALIKSITSVLIGLICIAIMSGATAVSASATTMMMMTTIPVSVVHNKPEQPPMSSGNMIDSNNNNNNNRIYPHDNRYFSIQTNGSEVERIQSNLKLLDYIIGSINTMYYDVTGGTNFDPRIFYIMSQQYIHDRTQQDPKLLSTRDGVVSMIHGLLNDILHDPYSSYLTREELQAELRSSSSDSHGSNSRQYQQELGIYVKEATLDVNQFLFGPSFSVSDITKSSSTLPHTDGLVSASASASPWLFAVQQSSSPSQLSPIQGYQLPVIVAVSPNSLGERLGLTVGDRIVAVPSSSSSSSSSSNNVNPTTSSNTGNSISESNNDMITVAKPVYDITYTKTNNIIADTNEIRSSFISSTMNDNIETSDGDWNADSSNHIRGYRPIRVRIPKSTDLDATEMMDLRQSASLLSSKKSGGNSYVQYEIISSTNSIFQKNHPMTNACTDPSRCNNDVGYIRLTRFSRATTKGFIDAVQTLESLGIRRYIIDVRNNYGGVIQEAMLSAATLLRDPHMVLCYTMNSRGGMTPHDVEEYVMDTRYSGYWLSRESHDVTRLQVQREHPTWFRSSSTDEWLPMSSFANLHEQHAKRGLKVSRVSNSRSMPSLAAMKELQHLAAQKDIVLLINEGTASSAEVFASSLHDNGRTVALVGTKTYGKGLVQHTFPTPDGGGLRLTVVEYLTPALQHVTHVGGAQYDRQTGAYVGGGIQPDISCDSIHGIPNNVGSDLCVGVAIDALNEADHAYQTTGQLSVKRVGGIDDGSRARRAVTMGILKDDF